MIISGHTTSTFTCLAVVLSGLSLCKECSCSLEWSGPGLLGGGWRGGLRGTCIPMYLYVHTHVHTQACTHTHTHILYVHKHVYTQTCIHTNMYTHKHVHTHVHTQSCIHTNMYTHVHTHVRTLTFAKGC